MGTDSANITRHLNQLQFFATPLHPCSYLDREDATTLFVDPHIPLDQDLYSILSEKGFRRTGQYLYRPHCATCAACIPVRIPVAQFNPTRRQRRAIKCNADLTVRQAPAHDSPTHYDLYARYISLRHANGDMFPPSIQQYRTFLLSDWAGTHFLELWRHDQLVAVAVTDQLNHGLSAVYTYFDPLEHKRSLGVYAILKQIEHCRTQGLPYLYLGYWVQACRKMAYKNEFHPLEAYINNKWVLLG